MAGEANLASFTLQIDAGADGDAEEIDRLSRDLQRELQEQDVEEVDLLAEGKAPSGAKSAEAITLGALAVAVLPAMVPRLIEFLQAWTMRGENRKVKIKTQVGDRAVEVEYSPETMSSQEVDDLVAQLLATMTGNQPQGD